MDLGLGDANPPQQGIRQALAGLPDDKMQHAQVAIQPGQDLFASKLI